jgi:hypothetical protein
MDTTKNSKITDLSYGIDIREDNAYFIEFKHILDDGWTVDDIARTNKSEPIFFRCIDEGIQQHQHGWIEYNKIVQWG